MSEKKLKTLGLEKNCNSIIESIELLTNVDKAIDKAAKLIEGESC